MNVSSGGWGKKGIRNRPSEMLFFADKTWKDAENIV